MNFISFRESVAKQLAKLQKHEHVFRVDLSKDELWDEYLKSFTPEQDPIHRVRTTHNCNCCKNFIRDVGAMVAFDGSKLITVWDIKTDSGYQHVADRLAALVRSKRIAAPYFHDTAKVGQQRSIHIDEAKVSTSYDHFYGTVNNKFVKDRRNIPTHVGQAQSSHQVFTRALREITLDAIETVSDLIKQNSLYRGSEHSNTIAQLLKHSRAVQGMSEQEIHKYGWQVFYTVSTAVQHVRNTSIGTLLNDLSEGVDLEEAVRRYERVVAPSNYKRPTALVTPKQVEAARKTLEENGLMSALHRRYAVLSDITVNNVLYADRNTKRKLANDPFDEVMSAAKKSSAKAKDFSEVREVPIDQFIENFLPGAETIEMYLENRHAGNFVSLIAPQDPSSNQLFKWNNNYSWSYSGELADSQIAQLVRAKGGNVTGELCIRLAWFNYDDLDLHVRTPSGQRVYFGNRRDSGLQLDVDENAGNGKTRTPVENIFANRIDQLPNGVYHVYVHNYCKRETVDVGFEMEIAVPGCTHSFKYDNAVVNCQTIECASITVMNGVVTDVTPHQVTSSAGKTQTVWNLNTNDFHPVNVVMLSPNYWDEQAVGNKHWFFMLNECANPDSTRGFYNEFLNDSLKDHRKAMELVGSKLKAAPASEQLSGLGFSSTKRDSVIVRVTGRIKQVVKVVF